MTQPPTAADTQPEFVTVREVAERLRVARMTVYRMVTNGELYSVKVRGSIRIASADVEAYLRNHPGEKATE